MSWNFIKISKNKDSLNASLQKEMLVPGALKLLLNQMIEGFDLQPGAGLRLESSGSISMKNGGHASFSLVPVQILE